MPSPRCTHTSSISSLPPVVRLTVARASLIIRLSRGVDGLHFTRAAQAPPEYEVSPDHQACAEQAQHQLYPRLFYDPHRRDYRDEHDDGKDRQERVGPHPYLEPLGSLALEAPPQDQLRDRYEQIDEQRYRDRK